MKQNPAPVWLAGRGAGRNIYGVDGGCVALAIAASGRLVNALEACKRIKEAIEANGNIIYCDMRGIWMNC
jgi:hypothetical protein